MKILQIVHSLPFLNQAGSEIYTYNLSCALSKKHNIYIFSRTCDAKQKEYEITEKDIDGITVYLINNTFRNCDSFEMFYENDAIDKRFAELLYRIKPDIVHIQHLVFLSTGLVKIIKDRGIPIVFTLHDYWLMCPRWHILKKDLTLCDRPFTQSFDEECINCLSEIINIKKGIKQAYHFSKKLLPTFMVRCLKKLYFSYVQGIADKDINIEKLKQRTLKIKTLLNHVDFFLAPSRFLRQKFLKFGIPQEKLKFSPYGLDDNSFKDRQKNKADRIRFAFIGTILPAKGLHILIKAFSRIDRKNVELKIYGKLYSYIGFEDYLFYLKRLVKNENIKFMGEFKQQDIAAVFKEIDVLIVPSIWYENSPFTIQEAFLSKTPVIASKIGGIPELIIDGLNGFLFNPNDIDDLEEKIQYIIDCPEMINKFKENVPEVKSKEDNGRETEELYVEITKHNYRNYRDK